MTAPMSFGLKKTDKKLTPGRKSVKKDEHRKLGTVISAISVKGVYRF